MKKKSKFDPIYTRDEAADIGEMFEKILLDNDISIPSLLPSYVSHTIRTPSSNSNSHKRHIDSRGRNALCNA